jgi:uncharacterized protein (DUF169 family)
MEHLENYRKMGEVLFDKLKLMTYPVGIKIVKKGETPPKGPFRPHEIFGDPLCTCTIGTWARRQGFSFYADKEDIHCLPSAVKYFGLREVENHPEPVHEGWAKHAGYKVDLTADKSSRATDATFKPGEIEGIVFSPLNKTVVKPDLVMIYCPPVILGHLILAATYDGSCITSEFNGMEASCKGIIKTYQSDECYIACPGLGDRSMSAPGDNEMIFFIPESKLETVVNNLFKAGNKLPGGGESVMIPQSIATLGSNKIYGKLPEPKVFAYIRRRFIEKD